MKAVNVAVGLGIVLLIAGLALIVFVRQRAAIDVLRCTMHLREIGLAVAAHTDAYKKYPHAVATSDPRPEKRLRWMTRLYGTFLNIPDRLFLELDQPWDSPKNSPVRGRAIVNNQLVFDGMQREVYDIEIFQCPADRTRPKKQSPCDTHYVGIAGLGENARSLPAGAANAGAFGDDRIEPSRRFAYGEGQSNTILAIESLHVGPWTAHGWPTARGVLTGQTPYLGSGGQFGGYHSAGTNTLFFDMSVKTLAPMTPQVFESMAVVRD